MKRKGNVMIIALVAVLALAVAALLFVVLRYHIVDFKLYPKDAAVLDLTGETISVSHYEKLHKVLPECEIHWDVPFQGKTVSSDTAEVTVTELTEEDVAALAYLPRLE